MKFLLDTNIVIPIEPTSTNDREAQTPLIASMICSIATQGSTVYLHPGSIEDLNRDKDPIRRNLRMELLSKYVQLPFPPPISKEMEAIVGTVQPGSNNEIDLRMLACVFCNAVDFFITNDNGIHRRAAKLDIADRVLTVSDAVLMVDSFRPDTIKTPPAVQLLLCHQLDIADPIFDSLRADYVGFNEWFAKAQREHRQAFAIIDTGGGIASVAIVKHETSGLLKICTFKVSQDAMGFKYGELILKAVFDYVLQRNIGRLYLTCFPKQSQLLMFLEQFGFVESSIQPNSEIVLEKSLVAPATLMDLTPLEYNVRYGPKNVWLSGVKKYVVPIQPQFHRMLFPDLELQQALFPGDLACGNSILKAYICRSAIKTLASGSILMFYRSQDSAKIRAVGVVDRCLRSTSAEEIARFVGKRTVYSMKQIQEICQPDAFAILFRYARNIDPISLKKMVAAGALKAAPQQITEIRTGADEWIQSILGA